MSTRKGQIKLGAFLMNTGHHVAAWRHPGAQEDGGLNFPHYRRLAQTAERAKFDMVFLADGVAVRRDPDQLKIMPGIFPVIGQTEQEAKEKYDQLQALIHPKVGLSLLSNLVGEVDLSVYPLDGPLPELPETNLQRSRLKLVQDWAAREKLTIRQLYEAIAGARGHRTIWGTPEQIADQLEEWFVNDAADGFNIMPPYLPGGLDEFVELVIPILQHRGLFRTEYEGRTLRENLGLSHPANQFSSVPSSVSV